MDSTRSISRRVNLLSPEKFSSDRRLAGVSERGAALTVMSAYREAFVGVILRHWRVSPNDSLMMEERSCQSALSGGSSMTRSMCVRGLGMCFRNTAMFPTSPVSCTRRREEKDDFDSLSSSSVSLRVDLRNAEKSYLSMDEMSLSLDMIELGVEDPERRYISSKNPSTAMGERPVKSSCRDRRAGRLESHCPTPDDSAPGAQSTTRCRESWQARRSVNELGRLVGELNENDVSLVFVDMSRRKSAIRASFLKFAPTSIAMSRRCAEMNIWQRPKPVGVSAFHTSSCRLGKRWRRVRASSRTGKMEAATLLAVSSYTTLRILELYLRMVSQSESCGFCDYNSVISVSAVNHTFCSHQTKSRSTSLLQNCRREKTEYRNERVKVPPQYVQGRL